MAVSVLTTACVTEQVDGQVRSAPDLVHAARINTQLGSDYARQGDYVLAEDKLKRAIEQDQRYAPAHMVYGFVLARRGRPAEAEAQYRIGLGLDPNDAGAHNQFGAFLCEQGRYAEGDKQFQIALRDASYVSPESVWANAGVCARRAGDLPRAEENLRQALKIQPEYAEALAQIADIAFQKQDWLRTRAFVQRYERVGPPRPELLYAAAIAERELGDTTAAGRYEAKLLRDFPESDQAVLLAKRSSSQQ
jgi:type IV pilus assembly protein PilF